MMMYLIAEEGGVDLVAYVCNFLELTGGQRGTRGVVGKVDYHQGRGWFDEGFQLLQVKGATIWHPMTDTAVTRCCQLCVGGDSVCDTCYWTTSYRL